MPRMVVVWCPDWPVVAAGAPPDSLTAVVHANWVVACSAAARAEGVRPGLRRREAQSRCPELELLAADPARDARAFEPVLAAIERLTPWVEVLQPGECAFPARGAARYHGGEPALAVTVTAAVHAALGGRGGPPVDRGGPGDRRGGPPVDRGGCRVGIADGTFAAGLAARSQTIVPPGGSRAFLAPLPVATIDRPDLADLLARLGLRTLGDLAALPRASLATRFGPEGARAARLAGGLDEQPRAARRPPPDLRVAAELDPPADRVDVAAFTAKTLADELVARLARLGLACARLRIEAETDQGERLSRVWRYDPGPVPPRRPAGPDPVPRSAGARRVGSADLSPPDPLSSGGLPLSPPDPSRRMAAVMAERVRWQLEGWLTGRADRLPGALTRLALVPDEVVPDRGRQLGFWGEETEAGQRAARALARIQGLLGPEAVHTARLRGGRDPADRVTLTPASDPPSPGAVPWPGQVPAPAPAIVYAEPRPAEVVDVAGATVAVDGRGLLGSLPNRVRILGRGRAWSAITAWAGPWLVDERWWDPAAHRRLVRLQATTDQGAAYLLRLAGGRWWVEAIYD
ncbi:MAG: domain protein DNA-repair protein [Actinomycetia bacterium]|nr:domain protein DNA-repair protein [Actinomycetes bacterium]